MDTITTTLSLLFVVALLGALSKRWPIPLPILLVVGGVVLSFVPALSAVRLDPNLFFVLFIPPLLYADGWLIPKREFVQYLRPILLLALGLVAATVIVVGWLIHTLLPEIPLAAAFALGAVISPTDAIATSAVTEKMRLPARITNIVNGESLINDATGLVAFKFAVAAVVSGVFSWTDLVASFVVLSAGGVAIGLLAAWAMGRLRKWLTCGKLSEPAIQAILSILTPYVAYLTAENLHVSGILAAVAAGIYSGIDDTKNLTTDTRVHTWEVWMLLLFALNGLVFLLLGLQLPSVMTALSNENTLELFIYAITLSMIVALLRLAWVYPGAYIPRLLFKSIRLREPRPHPKHVFIVGWAGIRGSVTLAAAFSIPLVTEQAVPFPGRELIIFLASSVIVFTLLLQGLTLPLFVKWLKITADGTAEKEERAARLSAAQAAIESIHRALSKESSKHESEFAEQLIAEYQARVHQLTANAQRRTQLHSQHEAEKRLRLRALQAERAELFQLHATKAINEEVLRIIQRDLDYQENMLRGTSEEV